MEIEWEDPPARSLSHRGVGGGGAMNVNPRLAAIRAACRAEPGRWAVYNRDVSRTMVGRYRDSYGAEGFQFTSARTTGHQGTIYVRFVACP